MSRQLPPRPRLLGQLLGLAAVAGLLGLSQPARAAQTFLQGRSETTITDLLFPWTQSSACACCVCWETAEATIMAYWDDQSYQGTGPWELLLPWGNGLDEGAFRQATDSFYTISGVACGGGGPIGDVVFNYCGPIADVGLAYTNTFLGYSFSYDQDEWVWFGWDIKDPISQGRPIYYVYTPEGNSAHAVVIVGYDDSDRTLYIYKNWDPVLSEKGFDEADEHCTIDFSPAGLAPAPASWSCGASSYGRGDGCDCACGSYDPDCDDPSQTVKNCAPGQECSNLGFCLSTCQDACLSGASDCASATDRRACRDVDGDGCLEWEQIPCADSEYCSKGECLACAPECEIGQARCLDASTLQVCNVDDYGCGFWGDAELCPVGALCKEGSCVPCPGGDCSGCLDECTPGQRRCYGVDSFQICVLDPGGCGSWAAPEACGAGSSCQGSSCQACPGGDCSSCLDECVPEQTRCAGESIVQLCDGHSPLGCLVWGSWVPCLVGEQCQEGTCVDAGGEGGQGGCSLSQNAPPSGGIGGALFCLLGLLCFWLRRRAGGAG